MHRGRHPNILDLAPASWTNAPTHYTHKVPHHIGRPRSTHECTRATPIDWSHLELGPTDASHEGAVKKRNTLRQIALDLFLPSERPCSTVQITPCKVITGSPMRVITGSHKAKSEHDNKEHSGRSLNCTAPSKSRRGLGSTAHMWTSSAHPRNPSTWHGGRVSHCIGHPESASGQEGSSSSASWPS